MLRLRRRKMWLISKPRQRSPGLVVGPATESVARGDRVGGVVRLPPARVSLAHLIFLSERAFCVVPKPPRRVC